MKLQSLSLISTIVLLAGCTSTVQITGTPESAPAKTSPVSIAPSSSAPADGGSVMVNPDGSVKISGGTGGGSVDVGGDGSIKIKGGTDDANAEDKEDSVTIDDDGIILEDAVDGVRITY